MKLTPNSRVLVLGGTGSIGQAVARQLLAGGYRVTLLVRSPGKAQALFAPHPLLTIVAGDAEDLPRLRAAAQGHDVLFNGLNYPYHQWEGTQEQVTRHVIEAASPQRALVVFPGNIYNFGLTTPIREDSPEAPISRKGAIRGRQEALLRAAAEVGRCRVLTLRLPDFWGPGVAHAGIAPVFEGALRGRAMPWLLTADLPHQFAYTPDAAAVLVQLLEAGLPLPYEVLNYGGQVMPSVRHFFNQIAQVAGQPAARVRVRPRWLLAGLAPFAPLVRAVREMLYLYDHAIVLDDAALRRRLPHWRETPLDEAIAATLRWFAEHQLGLPAAPATPAAAGTRPAFARSSA